MSKIIERIKKERLEARINKNDEKAKLLTTILGEIDRHEKKVETDEEAENVIRSWIKKIKKDVEKNPFDEQAELLTTLDHIEDEYLPEIKKMSKEELEEIVRAKGFTLKKELMPYLSKLERETGVVIDKRYASTLVK